MYMTHRTTQEGNKYHRTGNNQLVNWTIRTQGEHKLVNRTALKKSQRPYGNLHIHERLYQNLDRALTHAKKRRIHRTAENLQEETWSYTVQQAQGKGKTPYELQAPYRQGPTTVRPSRCLPYEQGATTVQPSRCLLYGYEKYRTAKEEYRTDNR